MCLRLLFLFGLWLIRVGITALSAVEEAHEKPFAQATSEN